MNTSDPRDELVEHLPALRAFALSLTRNGATADDMVQDTVVKAWTNIEKFEVGTNMRAWLFTILRNTYYSSRRKVKREVADVDLKTLGVVVEKNGEVVDVGAGAAVLGHPASSVAMLANLLAERGEHIPAGTFIMTGGITAAITVEPGDNISVRYQGLGTVTARFV